MRRAIALAAVVFLVGCATTSAATVANEADAGASRSLTLAMAAERQFLDCTTGYGTASASKNTEGINIGEAAVGACTEFLVTYTFHRKGYRHSAENAAMAREVAGGSTTSFRVMELRFSAADDAGADDGVALERRGKQAALQAAVAARP